jgi:hypothetical protein
VCRLCAASVLVAFFFIACWQLCLFYVSVTRTPPPDPFPAPLDDGKFSHHVLSYAHSVVSFVSVHGVEIE